MKAFILAAAIVTISYPAHGKEDCEPLSDVMLRAVVPFGEQPVFIGKTTRGGFLSIHRNNDTKTWTALVLSPDLQQVCGYMLGVDSRIVEDRGLIFR